MVHHDDEMKGRDSVGQGFSDALVKLIDTPTEAIIGMMTRQMVMAI